MARIPVPNDPFSRCTKVSMFLYCGECRQYDMSVLFYSQWHVASVSHVTCHTPQVRYRVACILTLSAVRLHGVQTDRNLLRRFSLYSWTIPLCRCRPVLRHYYKNHIRKYLRWNRCNIFDFNVFDTHSFPLALSFTKPMFNWPCLLILSVTKGISGKKSIEFIAIGWKGFTLIAQKAKKNCSKMARWHWIQIHRLLLIAHAARPEKRR